VSQAQLEAGLGVAGWLAWLVGGWCGALLALLALGWVRDQRPSLLLRFEPRDIWVGVFWDRRSDGLHVYVCLVPCLVLHVTLAELSAELEEQEGPLAGTREDRPSWGRKGNRDA
jgi:hypothetical protein